MVWLKNRQLFLEEPESTTRIKPGRCKKATSGSSDCRFQEFESKQWDKRDLNLSFSFSGKLICTIVPEKKVSMGAVQKNNKEMSIIGV